MKYALIISMIGKPVLVADNDLHELDNYSGVVIPLSRQVAYNVRSALIVHNLNIEIDGDCPDNYLELLYVTPYAVPVYYLDAEYNVNKGLLDRDYRSGKIELLNNFIYKIKKSPSAGTERG